MTQTSLLRDIRCTCHRLLLRVSSTSQARLQVKCARCGELLAFDVAKVDGAGNGTH